MANREDVTDSDTKDTEQDVTHSDLAARDNREDVTDRDLADSYLDDGDLARLTVSDVLSVMSTLRPKSRMNLCVIKIA